MSSAPSRSSGTDPFETALAQGLATLLRAVEAVQAANPVVLIDGRSGAGKTSLARALVREWPLRGRVQLIALDDVYPGWDGLREGARIARDDILIPHARGLVGVWRRWDWAAGGAAESHAVDPALPLIVEGAGILDARTERLSDIRVWLESPADSRKRRALDRDGEAYRPYWERWARQEAAHIDEDGPQQRATLVVRLP